MSGVFLLEQNGVPRGGDREFGRCAVDSPFQVYVALYWEIVMVVIHITSQPQRIVITTKKKNIPGRRLANVDILTQQKILCVEGNP